MKETEWNMREMKWKRKNKEKNSKKKKRKQTIEYLLLSRNENKVILNNY